MGCTAFGEWGQKKRGRGACEMKKRGRGACDEFIESRSKSSTDAMLSPNLLLQLQLSSALELPPLHLKREEARDVSDHPSHHTTDHDAKKTRNEESRSGRYILVILSAVLTTEHWNHEAENHDVEQHSKHPCCHHLEKQMKKGPREEEVRRGKRAGR
jgi:hypothetical protein